MRLQGEYANLLERAAYYRWESARRCSLPGGDPISGRPRTTASRLDCDEGRAAYRAMARVALEHAKRLRERYRDLIVMR